MRSFENSLIRRIDAQRAACGVKPQPQPKVEQVRVWRVADNLATFDFEGAIRREMSKLGVK